MSIFEAMKKRVYHAKSDDELRQLRLLIDLCTDGGGEHNEAKPELIYSGRNKLYRISLEGESYILKHFAPTSWMQSLYYTIWGKTKAERSHLYASRLVELQVGVAESIGYCLEYSPWGLVADSYHLSRDVGREAVHLQAHARAWATPEDFFPALAHFLVDCHSKGVEHLDLSPGNILYSPKSVREGKGYDFRLVDLNRMRLHDAPLSSEQITRNLCRLMNTRSTTRALAYYYARERSWDVAEWTKRLEEATDKFWRARWLKLSWRYAHRVSGIGRARFVWQMLRYVYHLRWGKRSVAEELYRRYLQREDIRHIERHRQGFSYRYR